MLRAPAGRRRTTRRIAVAGTFYLELQAPRDYATSPAMVQRVYSHLGTVRHRSEVVEYRVEQHAELLADRLTALQQLP